MLLWADSPFPIFQNGFLSIPLPAPIIVRSSFCCTGCCFPITSPPLPFKSLLFLKLHLLLTFPHPLPTLPKVSTPWKEKYYFLVQNHPCSKLNSDFFQSPSIPVLTYSFHWDGSKTQWTPPSFCSIPISSPTRHTMAHIRNQEPPSTSPPPTLKAIHLLHNQNERMLPTPS